MSTKRIVNLAPLAMLMVIAVLLAASVLTAAAADDHGARPIVRYATRSDATVALRQMPQIPPMPAVLGSIFEKPRKTLPKREGSSGSSGPDAVLQGPVSGPSAPSTQTNFEGVNNVNGVLPPDTQGDIGPNHYVQMVNLSFAIWDKSGNKLYGPVDNNTLWQGFGGPCETTNDGDPIVLYDHLADRWMMSQFALPNFPRGPFYQCIAVSQTPDPTGAWHRYEFTISDTKLNDYPKFGVWPDGYYMSVNQFECNPVRCNWAGAGVVAFERDQMLNGGAARMVYFDLETVDSNLGGMLPADLDGPVPPAGAPNPFVQVDDDTWGYSGQDQLQVWNFQVDWNNPTSSTFTFDHALPTAAFDANMCGYSRNCIQQPGGTNVDAISDRLMFRLQYRNFGAHETMVVNHTVDVDGTDHAGVRWYEMRNGGSGWGIFQQGTYAPDGDHRWMGSIAMNGAGDIALGYSVSSGSTYPSIRFTGRLAVDMPGDMTFEEGVIIAGSGYQEHSSGRWGDYSMMSVDPVDDCTFWYTQEYYAEVGNAPWQTRIGSFKLSECGPVDNPPTVSITNPADGSTVSGSVNITADATDDNGVTQVELFVDGASVGVDTDAPYAVSWDSTSVLDGDHTITATATDTIAQTATDSVGVTVDNTDDPPTANIVSPFDGSTISGVVTTQVDAADDRDAEGGLSVDVNIDGGAWQATIYNDISGLYEWDWDTTGLTDGTQHTIDARATDSGGNTTNATQVTVTVDNSEPTTMHVGDLDGSSTNEGRTWTAIVTITIHDANHSALAGAVVSGSWSNGGTASCTTDSSGQCSVSQNGIPKRTGSVTLMVTDVTDTLTYDSAYNHDPDGDSDGTSITVYKP
jgi:hypothetical protein